jgi:hypothetical protein
MPWWTLVSRPAHPYPKFQNPEKPCPGYVLERPCFTPGIGLCLNLPLKKFVRNPWRFQSFARVSTARCNGLIGRRV